MKFCRAVLEPRLIWKAKRLNLQYSIAMFVLQSSIFWPQLKIKSSNLECPLKYVWQNYLGYGIGKLDSLMPAKTYGLVEVRTTFVSSPKSNADLGITWDVPLVASTRLRPNLALILHAFSYRYARSVGAKHHQTSAKLNRGIDELFLDLTQQMISKADEKPKNGAGQPPTGRRGNNNITIVDDTNLNRNRGRSGCCGVGGSTAEIPPAEISTENNLTDPSR